jgi:hypothetical protein
MSGEAQQTDSEVTQAGHHARAKVGAYLGPIFVEGDVTHMMESILDAPVATIEREQSFWVSFIRRETGDEIGGLLVGFS